MVVINLRKAGRFQRVVPVEPANPDAIIMMHMKRNAKVKNNVYNVGHNIRHSPFYEDLEL